MTTDKLLVSVIGLGLILLTYWFFLGKSDRHDDQEHHH